MAVEKRKVIQVWQESYEKECLDFIAGLRPLIFLSKLWGFLPFKTVPLQQYPIMASLWHIEYIYCCVIIILQLIDVVPSFYAFTKFMPSSVDELTYVVAVRIKYFCYAVCVNFLAPRCLFLRLHHLQSAGQKLAQFDNYFGTTTRQICRHVWAISATLLVFNTAWVLTACYIHLDWIDWYTDRLNSPILGHMVYIVRWFNHSLSIYPLIWFCVLCYIVAQRFSQLGLNLKTTLAAYSIHWFAKIPPPYLVDDPKNNLPSLTHSIDDLRAAYCFLAEIAQQISHFFSTAMVLIFTPKLVETVVNIFDIVRCWMKSFKNGSSDYSHWVPLLLGYDLSCIALLLWAADIIPREARLVVEELKKVSLRDADPLIHQQVQAFQVQALSTSVKMTAGGYFTLGKKLLPSMVGTITTYIIVLIQFEQSGSNKMRIASSNTTTS